MFPAPLFLKALAWVSSRDGAAVCAAARHPNGPGSNPSCLGSLLAHTALGFVAIRHCTVTGKDQLLPYRNKNKVAPYRYTLTGTKK